MSGFRTRKVRRKWSNVLFVLVCSRPEDGGRHFKRVVLKREDFVPQLLSEESTNLRPPASRELLLPQSLHARVAGALPGTGGA